LFHFISSLLVPCRLSRGSLVGQQFEYYQPVSVAQRIASTSAWSSMDLSKKAYRPSCRAFPVCPIRKRGNYNDGRGVPPGTRSFQKIETADIRHAEVQDNAIAVRRALTLHEFPSRGERRGMETSRFQQHLKRSSNRRVIIGNGNF
jgi:hypothetical protein